MLSTSETLKVDAAQLRHAAVVPPTGVEEASVTKLFEAASDFLKDAVQRGAIEVKDANEWAGIIGSKQTFAAAMGEMLPMVYYMPITQVAATSQTGLDFRNFWTSDASMPVWPRHSLIGSEAAVSEPGDMLVATTAPTGAVVKGHNPSSEVLRALKLDGSLFAIDRQVGFAQGAELPSARTDFGQLQQVAEQMQLRELGMPNAEISWWKHAREIHRAMTEQRTQSGLEVDGATMQVPRLFGGKVDRYDRIHYVQEEFGRGTFSQGYLRDAGVLKVVPAVKV